MVLRHSLKQIGLLSALATAAIMIGCTQSETPLSSREKGFVDLYLLGKWSEYEPDDRGGFKVSRLAYDVSLGEDGALRVVQFDDGDTIDRVLSVYSTRLDGRKYANARVIECPGCNADERARLEKESCPYQIVQYSTFLPRSLASGDFDADDQALVETLTAEANARRGRFLFLVLMDSDYIEDAIEADVVEGDPNCDTCISDGPCLTSRGADLQQFLLDRDRELYSPDAWSVLIRTIND